MLSRVVAACDTDLRDSILHELRQESARRFRVVFMRRGRPRTLLVSLEPQMPWIGRPEGRWPSADGRLGPFAPSCQRALRGVALSGLGRPDGDRRVVLAFADGQQLVVELAGQAGNLVHLDRSGRVVACARQPRRSRSRLARGEAYRPPPLPTDRIDPFRAEAETIDRCIEARGGPSPEAIVRCLIGVGRSTASLLLEESRESGASVGDRLTRRLAELGRDELQPVIESKVEPLEAALSGELEPEEPRLLPWEPAGPPPAGLERFVRSDPAATAAAFHEALEQARALARRRELVLGILGREILRLRRAELKVAGDLAAFDRPDDRRLWGEALLAGLTRARRSGDRVWVPNPYEPEGESIAVPVPPGRRLERAAEDFFRQHRRAERGRERARERATQLNARRVRLERLRERRAAPGGRDGLAELEGEMRAEGIPLALEPPRRAGRTVSRLGRPRLEGVRLFDTADGMSALVGKSGKDNQRLTFKLAAPEDFWFHALGVHGAHVVLRNGERRASPPAASLEQAAAAAAWYSEARREPLVDVQWTRRKYVRKRRHAPPGTVTVKKSETIRVRPRRPAALDD